MSDYNRKRYYKTSRVESNSSLVHEVLELRTALAAALSHTKHLEAEVARLERELASRG